MHNNEDDRRWRTQLSTSLAHFATQAEAADLRVHLGDLREGCLNAISLIERLADQNASVDAVLVRNTLAHLKGELLHHMLPHIEGVAPSLNAVVLRLFREAEDRGEFADD